MLLNIARSTLRDDGCGYDIHHPSGNTQNYALQFHTMPAVVPAIQHTVYVSKEEQFLKTNKNQQENLISLRLRLRLSSIKFQGRPPASHSESTISEGEIYSSEVSKLIINVCSLGQYGKISTWNIPILLTINYQLLYLQGTTSYPKQSTNRS